MKQSRIQAPARRWVATRLSLLLCSVFASIGAQAEAEPATMPAANDVQFNPVFIDQGANGQPVDLSRFNRVGAALPGRYRADVFVNNNWLGSREVTMQEMAERKVQPCFSRTMLGEMGVDFSQLKDASLMEAELTQQCLDIASLVPAAYATFNSADLRLDVSIPQKYLRAQARGYVDPQYWDAGAPFAGFLNYNANAYRYDNGAAGSATQYFAAANAGLNIGLWRLRYNGSFSRAESSNSPSQNEFQTTAVYAQRDITDWRSVLTVGDYFTPGELFSSVPYRGLQLHSDDRMLPDSLQGYAPVVRGVAETNAKIAIRQNGNLIYENVVSPGEFSIDDLYNTGSSGDLEVTITEADGRVRKFVVPYAAVPQLLRPGQSRYSFTAGQWRDSALRQQPDFVQATYQRGISNNLTLYGGALAADHYQSGLFGVGINTPLGALALDATQSWAEDLPTNSDGSNEMSGQSYRLTYSKLLEMTRTNFTVAAYRYSTSGYLEFRDYTNLINQNGVVYRTKNRFQINVNQPLREGWGQLFLSASTQDYWNQSGRDLTYQLGYSNSLKWMSYSLTASRMHDALGRNVNQYNLSLTLPLGRAPYSPLLSASHTSSSDHSSNSQLNVSGTTGELHNLSYNAYANTSQSGSGSTSNGGGGSLQYASSAATFSVGASSSSGSSQLNAGISGALVFHPGGITAAQSLGESIAVIEAPGAEGALVGNSNGVRVNKDGYAVVPSLMPYRRNEITLDPKGMPQDVALLATTQTDAPRAGAIVLMKFATEQGKPVVVTLRQPDGSLLPMGTSISAAGQDAVAMVGQGGRAFLRGMEGKTLTASWGRNQQCRFSYQLPVQKVTKAYVQTEVTCGR